MKEEKIQLLDSPDYKTSCISTIKSFLGLEEYTESNEDIKSMNLKIFKQFNSSKRLEKLRLLMKLNNISTYIIPSEDEHQSEYTSIKDQRREFISGFTGSSGIAIVTLNKAVLSTDSRYFLQAEEQLDSNWILLKQGVKGYPNWIDWMINETIYEMNKFKNFGNISVDPRLISWDLGDKLKFKCYENNIKFLTDLEFNLIDKIRDNLPKNLNNKLILFPFKYNGELTKFKIKRLREIMKFEKCFVYISNMLDSISWLLNLRGNDIIFNPVFFCYTIIYHDKIIIYLDKKKLNNEIIEYLNDLNIIIKSYNEIWDDLPAITNNNNNKTNNYNKICLELNSSYSIYINIPSIYEIKFRSILTELKGIKNEIEIKNLKESQKIDSLAIIRLLSWFNNKNNKELLTELDIVDKLYEFRKQSLKFKGLSFQTIVATGSNSAIVHYEPNLNNFKEIEMNNILLIDSGGQYFEGTTDITRTIYTFKDKNVNKEIKKSYSLVLNGHLNIAMLKFKFGTSSYYIDSLGRKPLLKYGMNYGHGTGHGIDNYICVHAGPCGLSPSETSYNYKPLEIGNFISDEPGYYKDGEYGIRIESDLLVINDEDEDGEDNLKFDYLTLVPFCKELIDTKYLTIEQINWINKYHENVYQNLKSDLENVKDFEAIKWLREATLPI